jgi:hypothetical protein
MPTGYVRCQAGDPGEMVRLEGRDGAESGHVRDFRTFERFRCTLVSASIIIACPMVTMPPFRR